MLAHQLLRDARVGDRRVDLRRLRMMPGIGHQPLDVALVERGDRVDVEVAEGRAEGRSPAQDRDPRQPGLEALEAELLEQRPVAVQRRAPLLVVVPLVLGVVPGPRAARAAVVADDDRLDAVTRRTRRRASGARALELELRRRLVAARDADARRDVRDALVLEQPRLGRDALAAAVAGDAPVAAEHAVARHDDRDRVRADRAADRATGRRATGADAELAVGDDLAEVEGDELLPDRELERGAGERQREVEVAGGGRRSTPRAARRRGRARRRSARAAPSQGRAPSRLDGQRDDGLAVADHLDAADRAVEAAQVRRARGRRSSAVRGAVVVCMLRE